MNSEQGNPQPDQSHGAPPSAPIIAVISTVLLLVAYLGPWMRADDTLVYQEDVEALAWLPNGALAKLDIELVRDRPGVGTLDELREIEPFGEGRVISGSVSGELSGSDVFGFPWLLLVLASGAAGLFYRRTPCREAAIVIIASGLIAGVLMALWVVNLVIPATASLWTDGGLAWGVFPAIFGIWGLLWTGIFLWRGAPDWHLRSNDTAKA